MLHLPLQCPFPLPELISTGSFALRCLYVLTVSLHRLKSRHHWNKVLTHTPSPCRAAALLPQDCAHPQLHPVATWQGRPVPNSSQNSVFPFKTALQGIPPRLQPAVGNGRAALPGSCMPRDKTHSSAWGAQPWRRSWLGRWRCVQELQEET